MADQPSPSAAAVHRISRLKVAVACTIIRTKPSHLTAKQFAESLGQKERSGFCQEGYLAKCKFTLFMRQKHFSIILNFFNNS